MNAYTLIIKFVFKQGDKVIFFPTSQRFSEKVWICISASQDLESWTPCFRGDRTEMDCKDDPERFEGLVLLGWAQHGFSCVPSCRMLRLDVGKRERIKTYSNSSSSCSEFGGC